MSESIEVVKWEDVFWRIVKDERYIEGITYGKPRSGHPEGTVKEHILDLELNLQKMKPFLTDAEFWKLRILVHIHDCMKHFAQRDAPIEDPRSHASLAASLLKEYVSDSDLVNIIQYHDEGYALWKQMASRGFYSMPRFMKVIRLICDTELFLLFTILDGCVAGKDQGPVFWFINETKGQWGTSPRVLEAARFFYGNGVGYGRR